MSFINNSDSDGDYKDQHGSGLDDDDYSIQGAHANTEMGGENVDPGSARDRNFGGPTGIFL